MGVRERDKKGKQIPAYQTQENRFVRAIKNFIKKFGWTRFVRIFCGLIAIMFLVIFIIKLTNPALANGISLEVILISIAVAILLPYISSFEALGVKVGVKEQVEILSAWANATPYYTLASEYETEGDYNLAEQYYQKSLDECPDFWPSIFGLGSIYEEKGKRYISPHEYSMAIDYYRKTIELNKDNLYSYHNMAGAFLKAPPPVYSPENALQCAEKAIEIMPSFHDSLYFKGWALNSLNKPDYVQARNTLEKIENLPETKGYRHWIKFELAIAKSNLDTPVSVTGDVLEDMYRWASENREEDRLIEYLEKDTQRFGKTSTDAVQGFIKVRKP
jgi:tetratricopeptide (TPR) repeat protein